jgi:phosphoglycolate phosphatase-like HAD superfamily hydrolase
LLTGNSEKAAKIKLVHFALEHRFAFGGFGDHRTCRNDVARDAWQAASDHLQTRFDENQIWVIGDTPLDVECGRAINARTVAVLTGGFDRQTMAESQPDFLLDDLCGFEQIIARN